MTNKTLSPSVVSEFADASFSIVDLAFTLEFLKSGKKSQRGDDMRRAAVAQLIPLSTREKELLSRIAACRRDLITKPKPNKSSHSRIHARRCTDFDGIQNRPRPIKQLSEEMAQLEHELEGVRNQLGLILANMPPITGSGDE